MKIYNDDGELLLECADNAGVLVIGDGGEAELIMPSMEGEEVVPRHIMLAAALITYLADRDNIRAVMDYFKAVREKRHDHQHN